MMKFLVILAFLISLSVPASAVEIEAPTVPPKAEEWMPNITESFSDGLTEMLTKALRQLRPEFISGLQTGIYLLCIVLVLSILDVFSEKSERITALAATTAIMSLLLGNTHAMIGLGAETVAELREYGKLLLPVMTTAMAAQGGITTSAALYTGTAAFDAMLSRIITKLLIPMVYLFLMLSAGNSVTGEETLKRGKDLVKALISWCLKTILTVYTTYMSITGVISGTTDAATLKATKVTISSFVPVVGGVLSDASESILVSAGLVKNAAGIYGIFAILAVFLGPFMKIGAQYLMLKAVCAVASVFCPKKVNSILEDFAAAMGLLLAMTGTACLLLLISSVCFLRSVA